MDTNYTPNLDGSQHSGSQPFGSQHSGSQPDYNQGNFDPAQSYGTAAQLPQSHRAQTEEDPGKVLGIISLVATLSTFLGFNFIGPIIGIITGHMARKNSRGAGLADNEMGRWGFILGIVFIAVAALGGLLGLSIAGFAGLFGLLGA